MNDRRSRHHDGNARRVNRDPNLRRFSFEVLLPVLDQNLQKESREVMKLSAFPAVLLLLTGLRASADVVLEQKTESRKASGSSVMKIKGDRARIDMKSVMGDVSVFLDTTGKMATYIHQSKIAVVTTMSEAQINAQALLKKAGVEPQKPDAPKATGEREKIGDWNCEIWTHMTPAVTVKQWRTKEIPNFARIMDQMKVLASVPGMGIDQPDFDYFTVKTERSDAQETSTVTVVKITEVPVPDSDLSPPKGYREVAAPSK